MRTNSTTRLTLLCMTLCCGFCRVAAADLPKIKIGVIAPLTGPGAPWGQSAAGGVKIIAEQTNAAGGLDVGGVKYAVEVTAYDDRFKAADTVTAFNRLVNQDQAKFIFVMTSTGTMAVRDAVESNHVIALTSSMSSKVIDKNSKYMFVLYSTPYDYLPSMIDWLKANSLPALRRVAILNPNDESGWAQTALSTKLFESKGYKIVASDLFEGTQRDFEPTLTKVLAAKPDVIDLGGSPPATAGLIMRQAREFGFSGQFFKGASSGPEATLAAAGARDAEGMINMLFADPGNAAYQKLAAAYTTMTGNKPNEVILSYADATRVLLATVKKAGTVTDTAKIADSFKDTLPMPALQGTSIALGGNDVYGVNHQLRTVDYIGVIRSGKTVVVGETK
jgi:branched-chain amino acid transport system substrate-binding protein